MSVYDVPTALDLDTALTPPEDGSEVTSFKMMLSPQVIDHILTEMNYEQDPTIARLASETVADLMLADQLYADNQIRFALDADGNPKLVDGQVLLEAALATGWNKRWIVTCSWYEKHTAEVLYTAIRAFERNAAMSLVTKYDVVEILYS